MAALTINSYNNVFKPNKNEIDSFYILVMVACPTFLNI